MSTPKFAPGPWVVDWDDFVVRAKSPIDGRMVPVARPYGVGDDGSDVPGNARLIAAAPDLLARLKAAANYIDTLGGDSRECRIVIARAEGKS